MAEYANAKELTPIFAEPSINSELIAQIDLGSTVAVIEHGVLFSKIVKNSYEGFCETRYLSFENSGDINRDRVSPVMISLPADCACALYNALKFSLKL